MTLAQELRHRDVVSNYATEDLARAKMAEVYQAVRKSAGQDEHPSHYFAVQMDLFYHTASGDTVCLVIGMQVYHLLSDGNALFEAAESAASHTDVNEGDFRLCVSITLAQVAIVPSH